MRDWEHEMEAKERQARENPKRRIPLWAGAAAFLAFAALTAAFFAPKIVRSIKDSGVAELLAASKETAKPPLQRAKVCFVSRRGDEVLFKSEEVVLPPAPTPAHAAVEALLRGPSKKSGLQTLIPKGTRLIGLTVSCGYAFVDLSRKFNSDPDLARLAGSQIGLTLKNVVPDLVKTTILVEGKVLADIKQ